jgi:hypothetical protein
MLVDLQALRSVDEKAGRLLLVIGLSPRLSLSAPATSPCPFVLVRFKLPPRHLTHQRKLEALLP